MKQATKKDFSKEGIHHIIRKLGWAIMSAHSSKATDEVNARANEAMEWLLKALGLPYFKCTGKYGDVTEESFIVLKCNLSKALWIAKVFNQESVLTPIGLLQPNGICYPTTGGVNIYEEEPEDDFTSFEGLNFSIEIDWNNPLTLQIN